MKNHTKPLAFRFWSKVSQDQVGTGCLEWLGAMRGDGYGLMWGDDGKVESAHLISLRLHGIVMPEGMVADHMCRNRGCVYPGHLRIVTPLQNTLENNDSPFAMNSRKTRCIQGHPYTDDNLAIKKSKDGRPTRVCLICAPSAWMYAVISREPPPNARAKCWLGPYRLQPFAPVSETSVR